MSSSSSALRQEIEAKLALRIPSALTPVARPAPELLRCHDERLNALLGGGLPVAAISEVYGAESSGRTTLAMSLLSAVTASGRVAAWIDVSDALDPEAAAQCGVDLERLLWVRCGAGSPPAVVPAIACLGSSAPAGSQSYKPRPVGSGGCGSPHPRSEGNGMAEAIHALLEGQPRSAAQHGRRQRRAIGTPGAPNRPLMDFPRASPYREEQIPTDRLPARRGAPLSGAEKSPKAQAAARPCIPAGARPKLRATLKSAGEWAALDHALRVTDLLLQSGGFGLLVLDLAGTPAQTAWRIPLATWFRFRAACERSQAALLVLSQQACARASADRMVHMQPGAWDVQGSRVCAGITFGAAVEKERRTSSHVANVLSFQRKPPQSAPSSAWRVQAPWATPA